jgi:hypothetical protein
VVLTIGGQVVESLPRLDKSTFPLIQTEAALATTTKLLLELAESLTYDASARVTRYQCASFQVAHASERL